MEKFKFDIQLFADTTITIAPNLIMEAWAKETWEAGKEKTFFDKFTGTSPLSIVQVKEELTKTAGDKITIPLLLPLKNAAITGDNILEGNEEQLVYRDFSVTINQYRNGVRLQGRFDEQKTQINMRQDARDGLSEWLANLIDDMIFTALTTNPTSDRIIYGGTATAESGITVADKFDTDTIGRAKRMAIASLDEQIKPVKVNGADTYVMIIDPWQARDLTSDQRWVEAQQHANIRGEKNPIFTGALGMYNGVVVHQSGRIPRTATGASNAKVSHALFLGAQAAVFAEGEAPRWVEKNFDYENKAGFAIGRMFGIAKTQFKFDGTNLTDFGCINVLTSGADD